MRVIAFYLSLCFLLLCGGSYLYANKNQSGTTHSFGHNVIEKQQLKIRTTIPYSTLSESAAIDLDEEFHSDDDHNDGSANKLLAVNHSLASNWYLTFSAQIIAKNYTPSIEIFAPFCAYSNPIYIRQQVLRI